MEKNAIIVEEHDKYIKWRDNLRDNRARARIYTRIMQIREYGNFGKCKFFGDGVSELIIDYGPGYRVYYTMVGNTVILLLCGGDKSTQNEDITLAKRLAKEVKSDREK
jgi:putative addiction module killer protein